VLIHLATFSDGTVGHAYLCSSEYQFFYLVNKPAYLISPKLSGPEVGLRSEDYYTLLFCETYLLLLMQ